MVFLLLKLFATAKEIRHQKQEIDHLRGEVARKESAAARLQEAMSLSKLMP